MAHPSPQYNILKNDGSEAGMHAGNVPAVTHLHGGHTESASDGLA